MEKKNLLFIVPKLIGGGAEKTVSNLSVALQDKYNIHIIIFYDTEQKYSYGGNLIVLQKEKTRNLFKRVFDEIKLIRQVKKIKKELQIDYSVSFLRNADIVNVLSKHKEKTFVSVRNVESIESKTKFNKMKVRFACKMADKVVAISKEVGDDLANSFGIRKEKICTIYNPCPCYFDFWNAQKSDEKKTAVTVGRLTYQKGQWHLIRAFQKVVASISNAELLILGTGEEEDYLKSLISSLKLEDHVKLLGFVNDPYSYMCKSHLFVFPSLYEGLGNSLMEALMCGLPILSTDYKCGAREILAPDTDYKIKTVDHIDYEEYGVLVPVCDGVKYHYYDPLTKEEECMADAIIELFHNPEKLQHYSEKSIRRVQDFELDTIISEWEKLFK